MPTLAVDERQLLDAGFILVARNLGWTHTTIWRRDDEPERSFTDAEAVSWLDVHDAKEMKQ